ncbi:MAG: MFS transporter [Micrococcales bacterium]|nr:MFS transporter [Micrococcales bacterium]
MPEPTITQDRAQIQRRTIALLSLAQVFSGVGTGVVVSVGSLLAVDLSGSEALAGSVTTVMTLGAAFASVAISRVAFARGRRPALVSGLAAAALGTLVIVLAAMLGSFALLVLGGALMGFGNAVNLQARFAATDLSEVHHRGRDLGLVVWMSTVGAVAGPNLIGVGESVSGALGIPALSGIFVIAAAGMLVAMAVLWVGLRPDPYLVATSGHTGSPAHAGFRAGLRSLLDRPQARAAFIAILGAHAVMVGVMSMTPVHMSHHDASINLVGLTVSLHIAGMYALSPIMGMLTDRLGGTPMATAGLLASAVAALLAGFSGGSFVVTMAGLILLGLGWSAATIAGASMIVSAIPTAERVSAQGTADSMMSLAGAAGGALAGVALAAVGFEGLGVAGAIIGLACLVAVLAAARTNSARLAA